MRRSILCILVLAFALTASTTVVSAQTAPEFQLGFKVLADQIPDIVGTPVETEHYASNGDSIQQTTKGMMVWRKVDNWTAFTNGSTTWINGPVGMQSRLNDDIFPWEKATNKEGTLQNPSSLVAGEYVAFSDNYGQRIFHVRVVNVNHNATAAVMAASKFNTAPPPGETYVMVEIMLQYIKGDANKPYSTSDYGYSLEAGNQLWKLSDMAHPDPQFSGQNILPGATVTGWLSPVLVPTNLADSVLLYNSDYNWYFALK